MNTSQENVSAKPLAGIKVLDFSRILSGPYASMVLADLGAEIVKVEPLGKGDETRAFPPFQQGMSHYFIALNRSKKSVCLDLKSAEGLNIAKQLASQSDIVLENFRPGVMDRLGLGYEALKIDNQMLIYCSITGFGRTSPLKDKPAFDIVAQALSGLMDMNRESDQSPNKMSLPMGDLAGSIFSLFGLLAALHERHQTGHGRHVEVAMLDSLIAMQGYLSQLYFISGQCPKPVGTRHPSIVPYGSFPSSDGHVIVACLTEHFWHNFANCLGVPELVEDPRFSPYEKRLANRDELEAIICHLMEQESTDYWLDRLSEYDVPSAPILSVADALDQPHISAQGLLETVHHPDIGDLNMVRGPIQFDGAGPAPSGPPPLLGADTAEVLKTRLALDTDTIDDLVRRNIVSVA